VMQARSGGDFIKSHTIEEEKIVIGCEKVLPYGGEIGSRWKLHKNLEMGGERFKLKEILKKGKKRGENKKRVIFKAVKKERSSASNGGRRESIVKLSKKKKIKEKPSGEDRRVPQVTTESGGSRTQTWRELQTIFRKGRDDETERGRAKEIKW